MSVKKTTENRIGKGKPGPGRPKGTPNKATADIRSLAQKYGEEALDILAEIMRDKQRPAAARVSAAKELLDRGYGKTPQPIAVNTANIADVFGKLIEALPG